MPLSELGAPWRPPCRKAAGKVCAEAERAVVATVVGFVACLCCVEAGAVAWRFGPSHACQGVGCRYCDVSVPGDGRASCERTLGRGIRPALNSLLNARSGGDATRGRAPLAPPWAEEDDSRR